MTASETTYNQTQQLSTPIAVPTTTNTESPIDNNEISRYHSGVLSATSGRSYTLGSLQDSPLKDSKQKRRRKKRTPPPWEDRASPSSQRKSSTRKSASHSQMRRNGDDSAEELKAMNSELISKRKQFRDKLNDHIITMSESLHTFDIPKVSSTTSFNHYDDDICSSGVQSPRSMFRTHSYIRSPVEGTNRNLRSAGFEDATSPRARHVTPQHRTGHPVDWNVHAV